jgi:hypothetical protein
MGTGSERAGCGASSRVVWRLGLTLVALWPAPGLRAQGAGSATLRGTVLDPAGAAVPRAEVTATHVRTRAERRAVTDSAGGYVFPSLPSGPYHVRVVLSGFAPWESGEVHLSPGDSVQVDATLALAGQTEEVTVESTREMVRLDNGAREGLITSEQIENLSIIGRSAAELLRILPGTVPLAQSDLETVGFVAGANDIASQSVNGTRGTNISPVLDGSKITDFGSNTGLMINMNPDMVDEVKIQTGNYAAEYGSSAVQMTAVTKGGASSLHGSAYTYWRNWRLAANDRSNSDAGVPRPHSDYNYPGLTLSGPVLVPGTDFNKGRDKLFFFVGFEYQHQTIDEGTVLGVVPTRAQREGDFSELLGGSGQNLGQPRVVTIPAGFPGAGQPAPNNDLAPYVDPYGRAFLNIYPMPNHSDPDGRYNYAYSTPLPRNRWQLTSRLDWNVSPATHAYLRLALESEREENGRGLWSSSGYELPSRAIADNHSWSVAANVTSVLSPSLTNEIVVSGSRLKLDNDWEDPSKVTLSALGLEGYQGVFPSQTDEAPMEIVSFGHQNGALWANGGLPVFAHNDSLSITDNLTKVTNAHTLKLGVFIERGRKQQNLNTNTGALILAGPLTFWGTGNDYGDLFVGRMVQFQQSTAIPTGEFRFWNFEGYVQDSWKVRRNLTLEGGLRLSKMPNNAELTGLAVRFEPSAYDFSQGPFIDGDLQRPNGILLERRGEIPKGITDDPGLALMPRLNFAWDLRGNGDLTLRGGAGLFYNRPVGNAQYYVIRAVPNTYNVTALFYDVPGGLTIPSLPTIDPASHLGVSSFQSADPGSVHVPRTWNWSLAAAKRIPWSQTLEVAYVGHRADHLMGSSRANYIPPGALSGPYGNADLDNPLHRAALDGSVLAAHRLYPAYSNGSEWIQYQAESTYHALQITLSRPAAGRLQYYLNYTFSKVLGTTGNDYAQIDPIDAANRSYGIAPQDRTHIFNASYNIVLPDPIAPEGNALLRGLLNGWQVSGITSYRSGRPFRVVFGGDLGFDPMALAWWGTDAHGSGDSYNGSAGAIAPVFTGDPRLDNSGVGEKVLDLDRIAIPALGESGPFQAPYYFRFPSRWSWDLTVFKNFAVGEGKRLQLRVGFFNLFNQAAPLSNGDIDLTLQADCNVRVDGVPNGAGGLSYGVCDPTQGFHFSDYTKQNFGKIVTRRGHRVIELAARFEF